jgi:hypothetical protein
VGANVRRELDAFLSRCKQTSRKDTAACIAFRDECEVKLQEARKTIDRVIEDYAELIDLEVERRMQVRIEGQLVQLRQQMLDTVPIFTMSQENAHTSFDVL